MRNTQTKAGITIAAIAIAFLFVGHTVAEDGVTSQEIVLGQSCAITGPAQGLGTGMLRRAPCLLRQDQRGKGDPLAGRSA